VIAFAGMVVVIGPGAGLGASITSALACVGAAASYAAGYVYVRHAQPGEDGLCSVPMGATSVSPWHKTTEYPRCRRRGRRRLSGRAEGRPCAANMARRAHRQAIGLATAARLIDRLVAIAALIILINRGSRGSVA
jgi:hypothetical protein